MRGSISALATVAAVLASLLPFWAKCLTSTAFRDIKLDLKVFAWDRSRSQLLWQTLDRNASAEELELIFKDLQLSTEAAGEDRYRSVLANSIRTAGTAQKTALFIACMNRNAGEVQVLLRHRADASIGRIDEGTTCAHVAVGWLHSERVIDVLCATEGPTRMQVAASLRAKPASGGLRQHTPVWWSAYYGHVELQRRLIAWMRDLNWHYDEEADAFTQADDDDGELSAAQAIAIVQSHVELQQRLIPTSKAPSSGEVALSVETLLLLMRLAGADPSEAEGALYFEDLRRAGVQVVTVQVLEGVLEQHAVHHPPEGKRVAAEDAWEVIDTSGDGFVRGEERRRLVEMLTTTGEPLSEEETAEFLQAIDTDGDSEISRDEFMRMML